MADVITGLFDSQERAAQAICMLEDKGIDPGAISLLASDEFNRESFGVETHSKMSEGVAVGATSGAAIGALIAGLTAVGVLSGGAGLIVAGPLVAALAGAGAGAAGGSLLGGLVGWAIPEHEVKHYEEAIAKGSVLIGVHYEDSKQKKYAKEVFEECDAEKISHA